LDAARELARSASEEVLGRIAERGLKLLWPGPPGFADAANAMAAQHLARAWAIEVAA
jgi:hypothetical protein